MAQWGIFTQALEAKNIWAAVKVPHCENDERDEGRISSSLRGRDQVDFEVDGLLPSSLSFITS